METFPALLALCEVNPSVTGGLLSYDVSFNVSLCKPLNKQSRGGWIKMSWLSFDVFVMALIALNPPVW